MRPCSSLPVFLGNLACYSVCCMHAPRFRYKRNPLQYSSSMYFFLAKRQLLLFTEPKLESHGVHFSCLIHIPTGNLMTVLCHYATAVWKKQRQPVAFPVSQNITLYLHFPSFALPIILISFLFVLFPHRVTSFFLFSLFING
jgi:hypothetical protein